MRLSTPEQVQIFADVLCSNPDIGRAVRHVRLEGGYGRAMETVFKHVPNVETVYVDVYVPVKGRTVGLVRGLSLINPTRLYLHDHSSASRPRLGAPTNKNTKAVLQTILECLRGWTRLVSSALLCCVR